jgi:hypothetical protein
MDEGFSRWGLFLGFFLTACKDDPAKAQPTVIPLPTTPAVVEPVHTAEASAPTITCNRNTNIDDVCENEGKSGFTCTGGGGTVGDVTAKYWCVYLTASQFCCGTRKDKPNEPCPEHGCF